MVRLGDEDSGRRFLFEKSEGRSRNVAAEGLVHANVDLSNARKARELNSPGGDKRGGGEPKIH